MQINRWIIPCLVIGHTAQAHDYWLELDNFMPAAGAKVNVHLFVGDHFSRGKERAFRKKRTVSFKWIAADKTRDLVNQIKEDAERDSASYAQSAGPMSGHTAARLGVH